MTTSAQQIANQANAQESTGPITAAGKARSAMNSQTHRLCAKNILIGPEEQPDFDLLAHKYRFDLNPRGAVEKTLFDEILGAAWQLGRVRRMEAEACSGKTTFTEILDDEVLQKKLDRLARHHTRIERTFHRCLKELKSLQAQRLKEDKVTSDDLDMFERVNSAAIAPISQRTQSAESHSAGGDDNEPDATLTPEDLAEIDCDLDRMEAELAEQLRKRQCNAA